jgi:hypothetical protein
MPFRAETLTDLMQQDDLLRLIRAEYEEFPGLQLSESELEDLFEMNPETAMTLISVLVADGFLRRTADGGYVRS